MKNIMKKLWQNLSQITARCVDRRPATKSDSAPTPDDLSWINWDMTTEKGEQVRLFVPVLLPVDDVEFLIWLLPQVNVTTPPDPDETQIHQILTAQKHHVDAYTRLVAAYNAIGSLAAATTQPQGTAGPHA